LPPGPPNAARPSASKKHSTGSLDALEKLDVGPEPFVDQFLAEDSANVDILFLRQFAHHIIHI
jgi:hypothetical protein